MDNIESKRIEEISDDPAITDDDYYVIDNKGKTRKVSVSNFMVKSGEDDPTDDFGIPGMIYLKMSGNSINKVYFKLKSNTWTTILDSSYTPTQTTLSQMTWGEIATYTWGEIANFTW